MQAGDKDSIAYLSHTSVARPSVSFSSQPAHHSLYEKTLPRTDAWGNLFACLLQIIPLFGNEIMVGRPFAFSRYTLSSV